MSVFHPKNIAKDIEINTNISIQSARNLSDSQKSLIGLGLPELNKSKSVVIDMAKQKDVYRRSLIRSVFWIARAKMYSLLHVIGICKAIEKR